MANVALPSNSVPRRQINGVYADGRVHTAAANLSAGDTMDVAVVPAGGRIVGIHVQSDTAIAGTIDIGDGTTVDLFLDGSNALATANLVADANENLGETLAADTTVRITYLTAAPAAGDVVTAWVEMTLDDLQADSEAAV